MRKRREVSRLALFFLRPFFRYSYSRDAYVLRVIGSTRGPVLRLHGAVPLEPVVAEPVIALRRDAEAPAETTSP